MKQQPAQGAKVPPPCTPAPHNKKSKKPIIIIGVAVLVVAAWFVASSLFGPNSERGLAQRVQRLQEDSIALDGNFKPKGDYSLETISNEVDKIRSYGDALRYGGSEIDSARIFDNPRTAALAKYNKAKCDSVLADVLPLWRVTAIFAVSNQLKARNPNTIVKTNKDYPEYTGIEIYSIRYLSQKSQKQDAMNINPTLKELGFKSAIYAASPEAEGTEYHFE